MKKKIVLVMLGMALLACTPHSVYSAATPTEDEVKKGEAATQIQRLLRGHKVRQEARRQNLNRLEDAVNFVIGRLAEEGSFGGEDNKDAYAMMLRDYSDIVRQKIISPDRSPLTQFRNNESLNDFKSNLHIGDIESAISEDVGKRGVQDYKKHKDKIDELEKEKSQLMSFKGQARMLSDELKWKKEHFKKESASLSRQRNISAGLGTVAALMLLESLRDNSYIRSGARKMWSGLAKRFSGLFGPKKDAAPVTTRRSN